MTVKRIVTITSLDDCVDDHAGGRVTRGAAVPYQYQNEDLGSQAPGSSKGMIHVVCANWRSFCTVGG